MGPTSPTTEAKAQLTLRRFPAISQAWATSLLFHSVLLGVVACWTFSSPARDKSLTIDSGWQETPHREHLDKKGTELPALSFNVTSSAVQQQPITNLLAETDETPPDPTSQQTLVLPIESPVAALGLADPVPAGFPTGPTGTGTGNGKGAGDGPGFFGRTPDESRIVYVVDNSRSMNRPHDSPAKTRFRRVKLELVKSISQMSDHQGFFVIFFARDTFPMPAPDLQAATPAAKHHYLQWVSKMSSEGAPTDPREALQRALRLSPDKIYFLTDGEFDTRINRQLGTLQQSQISIDTFAFGDQIGEPLLKQIAANNGGTYTFIP